MAHRSDCSYRNGVVCRQHGVDPCIDNDSEEEEDEEEKESDLRFTFTTHLRVSGGPNSPQTTTKDLLPSWEPQPKSAPPSAACMDLVGVIHMDGRRHLTALQSMVEVCLQEVEGSPSSGTGATNPLKDCLLGLRLRLDQCRSEMWNLTALLSAAKAAPHPLHGGGGGATAAVSTNPPPTVVVASPQGNRSKMGRTNRATVAAAAGIRRSRASNRSSHPHVVSSPSQFRVQRKQRLNGTTPSPMGSIMAEVEEEEEEDDDDDKAVASASVVAGKVAVRNSTATSSKTKGAAEPTTTTTTIPVGSLYVPLGGRIIKHDEIVQHLEQHPNDVLGGKGGRGHTHCGDIQYRNLCKQYVAELERGSSSPPTNPMKNALSQRVVHEIQHVRGGRFLEPVTYGDMMKAGMSFAGTPPNPKKTYGWREKADALEKVKQYVRQQLSSRNAKQPPRRNTKSYVDALFEADLIPTPP